MNHTQNIELLLREIADLKTKNKELEYNIEQLQNVFGYEICDYFSKTNSLQKTTTFFYFSTVKDCYYALVNYYGCSDPVQNAIDYDELIGEENEEDEKCEEYSI